MDTLDNLLSAALRFEEKEKEASAELQNHCEEFKDWLKEQQVAFKACASRRSKTHSNDKVKDNKSKKKASLNSSNGSMKENMIKTEKSDDTDSTRTRRTAAVAATAKVKDQLNKNLTDKLRRPDTNDVITQIKQENSNSTSNKNSENELMPPPLVRPKRNARKKLGEITDNIPIETGISTKQIKQEKINGIVRVTRNTRSKAKNNAAVHEVTNRKDSDVIMSDFIVPIVDISDSEEEKSPIKKTKASTDSAADTENFKEESTKSCKDETEEIPEKKARTKRKIASKKEAVESEKATAVEGKVDGRKRNVSTSEDEASATKPTSKRTKPKLKKTKKIVQEQSSENEDPALDIIKNVSEIHSPNLNNPVNETVTISNTTVVVTTPKSNVNSLMNKTVVLSKAINATMIVSSPNKQYDQVCPDSLLTEDEDPLPEELPPPKSPNKGVQKPVFNPYSSSPVKQRVEAYEKMANAAANEEIPPARITRTKKKNDDKKQEEQKLNEETAAKDKPAAKFLTPTINARSLVSVTIGSASKFNSVTKPLTTEQKERAMKRKEKEEEAQKKKENMLRLKAEQQKRKREEQQQKVQMTREAQEKEKKLILEKEHQEKQAKLQKLLAEKEEMKKKMKEESQRKQLQAKKLLEEKRKVDAQLPEFYEKEMERKAEKEKQMKLAQQKQQETEKPVVKTPEIIDKSKPRPNWASTANLNSQAIAQSCIPDQVVNAFFSCRPHTMNLREVFPSINPRSLQRKSSACWSTPPKYSTFDSE